MNAGQVEAHVVAALKARRSGGGLEHAPVPSRDDLVNSIRLAHASAARRATRIARKAV